MKWTIEYLEEEKVVFIETSGVIDWDEHEQMCREAYRVAQEHGAHKYLADYRKLEEALPVLQINDLPRMLREIGLRGEDKVAVVYHPKLENKFKFFRSVSKYALFNIELFTDKDKAMKWLKPGK